MCANIDVGTCFLTEKFFGRKAGRNSPWMGGGGKEGNMGLVIIPWLDMARIYAYPLT